MNLLLKQQGHSSPFLPPGAVSSRCWIGQWTVLARIESKEAY